MYTKSFLILLFFAFFVVGCELSKPGRSPAFDPCSGQSARYSPNCHPTGWPPPALDTATSRPEPIRPPPLARDGRTPLSDITLTLTPQANCVAPSNNIWESIGLDGQTIRALA